MESAACTVAITSQQDSFPLETEPSATHSPSQDYCCSGDPGSVEEEAKDLYIAVDVKEESQFSPSILEGEDCGGGKEDQNIDSYKQGQESQAKHAQGEEGGECRVCHLVLDNNEPAVGEIMELGCNCKDDLSLAHRHCAEAWFKIKGNRTCEICGAVAQNVTGVEDVRLLDQWNGRDAGSFSTGEPARCWQGQPLCNFLLACVVIALILPWLFRVSVF